MYVIKRSSQHALATLILTLLLVAGCSPISGGGSSAPSSSPASSGGGVGSTGAKTIGIVSLGAANGGSARMIASVKDEAGKLGWQVQVVDTAGDPTKVPPTIQSFISAKVSGIIVDILDPTAYASQANAAKAAGIPIISVNSVDYQPYILTQIGIEPFALGAAQGKYFVDRLDGKGNVAVLTFSAASNLRLREDTFESVLSHYPGMHVIAKHEVNVVSALSDAQAVTKSWLQQYPPGQLAAIWAGWDEPALGASSAIDASGRKDVWVEGADFDPAVGQRMAQGGSFQAEWFIDYVLEGKEAVKAFQQAFAGQTVRKHLWLPEHLITQDSPPPSGQFPPTLPVYTTT